MTLRQQRETGSLERKPIPGYPRRIGPEREAALRARLEAAPDATVLEHCAWWAEHHGQQLSEATMWRAIAQPPPSPNSAAALPRKSCRRSASLIWKGKAQRASSWSQCG